VSGVFGAARAQPFSVSAGEVCDKSVDIVERLDAAEFAEFYVARRRPVLIKGALNNTSAFANWSFAQVRRDAGDKSMLLKDWGPNGEILTREMRVDAYLDDIDRYEAQRTTGDASVVRPPYLHDVPLTRIFPDAATALAGFPEEFFPKWYGADWSAFAQFFLCPSTSVTPLHFDCLLTHNLFFQLRGRKRFIVLEHAQRDKCYVHDWRWCAVDPEAPDVAKHPLYQLATPHQILVEPGDVFFMPSGMLHHVRSLDASMSFNVDWHTRDSAVDGVLAALRGMPLRNVYYNLVVAFGLWTGVSSRSLMPFYKNYLSYVS
jgi:hypothetical protein